MTSRFRSTAVYRIPPQNPILYNSDKIKNIVFFNYYHIGDVLTSKGLVAAIIAQNPQFHYTYLLQAGSALLQDISGLQVHFFGSYKLPFELKKDANFVFINDKTVAINMWIGAQGTKDSLPTRTIECHFEKTYANLQKRLAPLPLKLNSVLPTSLVPSYTVPPSEKLVKFNAWKAANSGALMVLYHNYQPRSNQLFGIQSHDSVIVELASRFPTINWLVAVHSPDLVKKHIPNIIDCATEFDCAQTKTCENLLQLLTIAQHCTCQVHFDIGASFTFANSRLTESACITLYASSLPDFFYFHRLAENYSDNADIFTQKVIPVVLDGAFVESLSNKIETLGSL